MNSYGKIYGSYFTDPKTYALEDAPKLLGIYLFGGPHRNIIGCSRVPIGYIAADLHWTEEKTAEALRKLSEVGFIVRDDDGQTLVRNQLRHDPLVSPNHGKAAIKVLANIPRNSQAFRALAPILADALEALGKDFASTVEDLRQTSSTPNPSPDPSPVPEPNPGPAPVPGAAPQLSLQTPTAARSSRKASPLPVDWSLSPELRRIAEDILASRGLQSVDIDLEAERFKAHAQAKGRTQKDWTAAWRAWCVSPYLKAPTLGQSSSGGMQSNKMAAGEHALRIISGGAA